MSKKELESNRRIKGWDFELISQSNGNDVFYQCRGEVMYDDYHDQMPEPSLWKAAIKLEGILFKEGHKVEATHSEKGWVEVVIN